LEVTKANTKVDRSAREELVRRRLCESPYCDRRIHVTAGISRTKATFVIRDQGPGFDVARYHATRDLPNDEGGAGRGLSLVRGIVDEVIYNQAGNEVTLIKRASQRALSDGDGI